MAKFFLIVGLLLAQQTWAIDHKHHVAVFTGATHSHEISYGTFGLDYEYRLSEAWGVGALYETIQSDPSATIVLVTGSLHLSDWMLTAGVGKEENHGHSEDLKRLGVTYHSHLSPFTISPSVNYDFIDDGNSAVVYGLLWGIGF